MQYWDRMLATLKLKELITASEDTSLITAEQEKYT